MTNTSPIFERLTSLIINGAFSQSNPEKDSRQQLIAFLKENDPNFPSGEDGTARAVFWMRTPKKDVFVATYHTGFRGARRNPLNALSDEAAVAVATLVSQTGKYIPELEADQGITAAELSVYAQARNPLFTVVKDYFDAEAAALEAQRAVHSTRIRTAWAFWPHADLSAVLVGNDTTELERVKALPYQLRLEAGAILSFAAAVEPTVLDFFKLILPELSPPDTNIFNLLTATWKPFSRDYWYDALKHRASTIEGWSSIMKEDLNFNLFAWVDDARTADEHRKRSLAVPHTILNRWVGANLDSFPEVKPSDPSDKTELLAWAYRASRTPEGLLEIEKVYADLPKAHKIMLVRQPGELGDALNAILLRTSKRHQLEATKSVAEKE